MARMLINGQEIFGNVNIGSGGGSEDMHNYSTTEHIVGTWTDGSTLYEKTVEVGTLTYGTSWNEMAHNISNVNKVISIQGIFQDTSAGNWLQIPAYRPVNQLGVLMACDSTKIKWINNWITSENAENAVVTIQYTKTV